MIFPSQADSARWLQRLLKATRGSTRRLALLGLCSASVVIAQVNNEGVSSAAKDVAMESEEGIPVTDKLTIEKCGACHEQDKKGNMTRISWSRTTPEGWSQAIKRMVKLNGLQITPEESRAVVKYLSTWHGLAPEEAKPVMYLPERRIVDETLIPNDTVRQACASCHAFAQPMSWRRSKTEWKLLQDMHIALYSQADAQYRRPADPQPGSPPAAPGTPPVSNGQIALEYIQKTAPLHAMEWGSWKPRIRTPYLAGKWLISAHLPGRGDYVGELNVTPAKEADSFTTSTTLRSLATGETLTRTGTGLVYAGYSWRGRSHGPAAGAAPDDPNMETRETMWFSPDQKTGQGRWFWGEYHEFGFDVTLTRAGTEAAVVGIAPVILKAGTRGAQVRIVGANLPADLKPADISLGEGVTVAKILSASPGEVVITADVASDAVSGRHDVGVRSATLAQALPVYQKIDYLKVLPETGLARLGGDTHPKGYGQFEAIGYENGPDGKPATADDVKIGAVDVDWKIDEFMAVYDDDDKDYVGTLSPTALFTPGLEGPNPARRFGRNNYGEVWVVATAKNEKDKFGQPLTGRAYLIVTVPQYQRWDQPEVSQ